jgi:MFS family permease
MGRSPFAVNPAFRRYWFARLASYSGDQIARTALLIAVFSGQGGTAMGLLLLAGTAPRLLGPLLGALADRHDQRRIMIGCDLGQAVLYLALALTHPPLPVLLVSIAAATTLATLFSPSGRSLLPRMVGLPAIPAANAQLAVAMNAGTAAGPALGGLLLAWLGLTGTLLVNVVTFGTSAALIAYGRLPALRSEPAPRGEPVPKGEPAETGEPSAAGEPAETFGDGLRSGLAVVRRNPVVRTVCAALFLSVLFAALENVAVIPLGLTRLHASQSLVGLLETGYGIGMIGSPLLLAYLMRGRDAPAATRVLYLALLGMGAGTLLTGVSPVLAVALVGQALAGAGNGWQNVANDTLIQQHVPQHRLGTVFGTVYTFPYAAATLSYALGGPLLAWLGPRWLLALSGAGVLLSLGVGLRIGGRALAQAATPPATQGIGPDTAVAASGPT